MHAIHHISSPYSATWVAWLLFGLLMLLLFNRSSRTDLSLIIRNVLSRSERYYTTQTQNWTNSIMTAVFELGVVGMMVYLLVYQQGAFEAVSYLQVVGITALVYFLQWICIWIVGHVFLSVKNYANAIEQYYSLRALVCLLMYPLLVIAVNIPYMMVVKIVLGVIVGIYVILLSSKLLWLFYKNIMSLVYTVLYIVCLECIPAAAVMIWAKQIV